MTTTAEIFISDNGNVYNLSFKYESDLQASEDTREILDVLLTPFTGELHIQEQLDLLDKLNVAHLKDGELVFESRAFDLLDEALKAERDLQNEKEDEE